MRPRALRHGHSSPFAKRPLMCDVEEGSTLAWWEALAPHGRGDVAARGKAARRAGRVVGIDQVLGALAFASSRARGDAHERDLRRWRLRAIGPEHGVFDAAVGRRVLGYQADAVAALRAVVRVLRSGALVVFQEADAAMVPGRHGVPRIASPSLGRRGGQPRRRRVQAVDRRATSTACERLRPLTGAPSMEDITSKIGSGWQ